MRRTPGRPASSTADHREALLDAARDLYSTQGVAATSLREIAARAKVTPALANYYFGDKSGLLDAVMEFRVAPLVQQLVSAVRSHDPAQPLGALRGFVSHYTATAAAQPWLPQLIVREVLTAQGALRTAFPQRFASGVTALLRGLIVAAQTNGSLRADLDPARVVMSIIGACVFPFIAIPLVVDTLDIDVTPSGAMQLASHHLAVLFDGIASP